MMKIDQGFSVQFFPFPDYPILQQYISLNVSVEFHRFLSTQIKFEVLPQNIQPLGNFFEN